MAKQESDILGPVVQVGSILLLGYFAMKYLPTFLQQVTASQQQKQAASKSGRGGSSGGGSSAGNGAAAQAAAGGLFNDLRSAWAAVSVSASQDAMAQAYDSATQTQQYLNPTEQNGGLIPTTGETAGPPQQTADGYYISPDGQQVGEDWSITHPDSGLAPLGEAPPITDVGGAAGDGGWDVPYDSGGDQMEGF